MGRNLGQRLSADEQLHNIGKLDSHLVSMRGSEGLAKVVTSKASGARATPTAEGADGLDDVLHRHLGHSS